MRKIVALLGVAVVGVVATGCGVPAPPPAPGVLGRQQQVMAACMKGRGLAYTPAAPGTPAPPAADELRRRAGDHAAMREYRARYGFGVFAELVHPADPLAYAPETLPPLAALPDADPLLATAPSERPAVPAATPTGARVPEPPAIGTPTTEAHVPDGPAGTHPAIGTPVAVEPGTPPVSERGTDGGSADAYAAATVECYVSAVRQTLGRDVTDAAHLRRKYVRALGLAWKNELDTDRGLIALAESYATCLTGKGYEVDTTAPTELATLERDRFAALKEKLEQAATRRHKDGQGERGDGRGDRRVGQGDLRDSRDDLRGPRDDARTGRGDAGTGSSDAEAGRDDARATDARVGRDRPGGREGEGPSSVVDVSAESPPALPARLAKPYLRREIATALDDLECGKRFFAVYRPRQEAVAERLAATWGLDQ
ncbi:hypothetical protein HTZ77_28530 [Nonomuraea sp. SMC257]|uniref:Uncharacterized protein n=1 Tax=Nonomuraea montanisoli TaxID=2741721 RepID=A0A7Y6IC16_9ACTN|nr:hypothetical protein [Nonomuraea montanisoli]NUW35351.1 hypothetical protein [Nonomuraea montanisoli]